jgi:hypothetical protein
MGSCKRGNKHYAALEPVRNGHFAHICSILPTSAPCIWYLIVCICSIEIPTRYTWIYMYSLFLYIFSLHVSGAIFTHPQERKLKSTALGLCNGCVMLVKWSSNTPMDQHTTIITHT